MLLYYLLTDPALAPKKGRILTLYVKPRISAAFLAQIISKIKRIS